MKTVTITNLAKKQVTLTLRPTSGLGAEPNIFVSAEVFAEYEADAANYTRERAIAEYQELKDLALANKDYDVVRKIQADILRLKMLKRGSCYKEIFFAADADLAAIPIGASFDEIVQSGIAHAVKSSSDNAKKDDLSQINGDTALHHSSATEEANQHKSVASIVGERMKLLKKKHDSKEFTRDVAYASFEELRHVSMRHGGLNTARLLIRDKCEICDIPSLHQRKFTKSPAEQKEEAEESAREKRIDAAEKEAALAWSQAEFAWLQKQAAQKNGAPHETQRAWAKAEQEAAERGRQAEERLAEEGVEEDWVEEDYSWIKKTVVDEIAFKFSSEKIEHFVKTYPCHGEESGLIRDRLVKEELRKVHAYAAEQKRQGSKKNFEITPALARNIFVLLFDYKHLKKKHPSINETPEEEAQTNALFAPYLVPGNESLVTSANKIPTKEVPTTNSSGVDPPN